MLEEVLQRQSEDIRQFLVYTSILDQLNSELCDVIMERQDSQAILETLELKDGIFLSQ